MALTLRITWSLMGFFGSLLAGIIAVELVRYLAGSHGYYRPPPGGVLIGALAGAWVGWRYAPSPSRIRELVSRLTETAELRVLIALFVPWALVVLGAVLIFDAIPTRYLSFSPAYPTTLAQQAWFQLISLLFGPPAIIAIAVRLFRWATASR